MPTASSSLLDPSVEVILAYSSTGLGHLRVTNALFEAAPKGVLPRLLRTKDPTASYLHKLTSMHPLSRSVLEWSQNGLPEAIFTGLYRFVLRHSYKGIEAELMTLIEQEFTIIKTVVIVATHFGLAHQIAGAKEELSRTLGVRIVLVVVVTDDSPQKVWYVAGANYLIVPSEETKRALAQYGQARHFEPVKMITSPYPVSPRLAKALSVKQLRAREVQYDPNSSERVQFCVPISGAAVNLDYLENLMTSLYRKNPRFHFYVVCRENLYTAGFLKKLSRRPYVSLITSKYDREIVKYYNDLVSTTVMAFEITKPSEQTFKVLLPKTSFGGMTLLFSSPVGRQEYDNLSYVKRNNLLETRAFNLSSNSRSAAEEIYARLKDKTFLHLFKQKENIGSDAHGSQIFWENIEQLV